MRKIRNLTLLVTAILVLLYTAISLSPLKEGIGRRSPEIASLFAPTWFNFSSVYEDGSVLQFTVGMSKPAVFAILNEQYANQADLTVNCVVSTANSVVPISGTLDIGETYGGGPRLCVRLDSRRLPVGFVFRDDVVAEIEVAFVRSEAP